MTFIERKVAKKVGILSRSIVSFFSRDHANLLCIVANFSISSLKETWNWNNTTGVIKCWDAVDLFILWYLTINCIEPTVKKHFDPCRWTCSECSWMIPFCCSQWINHNLPWKNLWQWSRFNHGHVLVFHSSYLPWRPELWSPRQLGVR